MRFAELHAGQVLEIGDYTVTEQDIIEFARQFDPQPFHVDKAAAQATRWQGLISSGFHTCSIAMRMVVDHILRDSESIGSPGLDYVKWPNPVRGGDRLRMRVHVLEARPSKSNRVGVVRWEWHMLNQHDQPVLEIAAVSLFALQPD
jgi:acyl dehydratase